MSLNYKLGDINAESYVSTSFANTYFAARGAGVSNWTALSTTATKEAYLKQACSELDFNNFIGNKYYESQSLQFPRDDHETYSGACASPGISSFKGSNLWSSEYNAIPTDYFKDGTVHITSGTSKGDIRIIESSNSSNGMIHVASSFSATLDTTSNYLVFAPIYSEIQKAQCEQVIYNLTGDLSRYLEFKSQGISGAMVGDTSVSFQKYGNSPITLNVLGFYAKRYISRFLRKDTRMSRA